MVCQPCTGRVGTQAHFLSAHQHLEMQGKAIEVNTTKSEDPAWIQQQLQRLQGKREHTLKQIAAAEKGLAEKLRSRGAANATAKLEGSLLGFKRRQVEVEHEISLLESYLLPQGRDKLEWPVRNLHRCFTDTTSYASLAEDSLSVRPVAQSESHTLRWITTSFGQVHSRKDLDVCGQ